ncbi:hypothetical protein JG688_00001256 [Phytophthora aleatoria]|uniref:Protein kinase domain-containing protein n=1 Tax=Phytophthora aleatoria TaxID=2496075 RepID=A0A8J5MBM0_9STRA|nr:hypothetical protein JG688_00001256 [Phytophthora aleatoria]
MPVRRGVVASVVRTASFHVATFAYACVLGAFFAISGSLLLLLVGCLLVGSSQFARKLTKVLWRTEMAIDALVADNDELGSVLRRRRSSQRTGQDVPEQEDPVLGEVTLPVMLLSLLYFLVFKWILDMIFSAVPLILWVVSLAQVLPKDAGLSDVNIVSTGTTAAQVFAAVAFAFLAHQLGVTVEHNEREDKRSVSIAPVSQAGSSRDISDLEILGHYGNITRSYEDDDVTNMRAYAPLSYTDSPPQYITALDPSPIYRGSSDQPDYDSFSPMNSPRSSGAGRGSFDVDHVYDLLSPTNSIHDADFPTDKFQQVYRSIQMAAVPESRRSMAAEKGGLEAKSEFKGVSGRRDRVNFSAFAPPSVCLSPKPFQFTVWAFLLNQRSEMQELAKSDHPESRKLSLESKLDVRRGALVHVTLEVPNGFEVLNGATQGFAWEGDISSVDYDVVCTEGAAFGRVLFKARITVGSSVAVLNSFVLVGSRVMEPSELEVDVLEGWMDVMEQTYREIPFRSLEMKELVGQGYFGDAYRASLDGQDVVVKTIRASEFGDTTSQIVREFQHEAAMLNMFGHHPCIVPFVGASTDTKFPLALVTKYLPYGSLEDNLRGSSSLSIDERTGMLKDAAAGLLNIHEGGFIHRDLAARNCLVDQGSRVRICDFGLCRCVRSETAGMLMKDAVGPVKYMAPESLQPPHAFSYDSDVYMFGVLMWETFTSSLPFASLTPVEAMMHVLRGERLPVPKELPESLQTLMQNCFHDSPAERPSMQEVVTALDNSLVSSQRASAAIATASAAAATSTAMANMWPERVQAFTNELHKRRDFLPMPEPAFTLPEIQNHLNELCEIAPTGPVKSLSKGWYPKRTELLQTIDNNTIGESNEVKTVLFNHAVKEKGWNFSATIEQVKWKLGRRATFLALVEYVYTDQVNVSSDNVELFVAADRFGIESLKKQCSKKLLESLCIDNAAKTLLAAIQHNDPVLRDTCFSFTLRNLEKVSKTKSFHEMAKRDPEMVVKIVQKVSTLVHIA